MHTPAVRSVRARQKAQRRIVSAVGFHGLLRRPSSAPAADGRGGAVFHSTTMALVHRSPAEHRQGTPVLYTPGGYTADEARISA